MCGDVLFLEHPWLKPSKTQIRDDKTVRDEGNVPREVSPVV